MTDLPDVIPIFPLPNVVLFPGAPLPLHIFEPRYRDLVRDSSRSAHQLIGMVLLRGDWRARYYGFPEVFLVGCAGRMARVEALADGRYNILLHGLREFAIEEELRRHRYRQARVRWRPPAPGVLDPVQRADLRDLLGRFVAKWGPPAAEKLLSEPAMSDELLVNFSCYALGFSPLEKQALLEAEPLRARAARLQEALEFALDAGRRTAGDRGDEPCH